MAETDLPADDYLKSLNGFDEIAITKAFDGADVATGMAKKPSTLLRALVFVDKRRQGMKDGEAYQAALSLTLQQLEDYFPDETPEVFEEEPVTPQGEDDAPST